MNKNTPYFPFGFVYPNGMRHNNANPDPAIENIRKRMDYLNQLYAMSSMPGHQFAAALDLMQSASTLSPAEFWSNIRSQLTDTDVVAIASELQPHVASEPPRLDFPNAIPLFDCRFVSTEEWEYVRRYSIGGSEVAAVLQKSHFQSRRTLYMEKKSLSIPDKKSIGLQHILDYGHAVEDYVISYFANSVGAVVYPEHRMFAHREYPFITCNPDGILLFADGHLSLFEAKTAMWLKYTDWKEGIPDYYEPQPRQYLEVLNDPRVNDGYIGVCFGGLEKDMKMHHFVRDPSAGAAQVNAIVDFWNQHIAIDNVPEFSGDAKLDLMAEYKYGQHNEVASKTEKLPASLLPAFTAYFEANKKRKVIDKDISNTKAEESILTEKIRDALPDGLTIVKAPNELPLYVRISSSKRDTVNESELKQKAGNDISALQEMQEKQKEEEINWNTPKISHIKKRTLKK